MQRQERQKIFSEKKQVKAFSLLNKKLVSTLKSSFLNSTSTEYVHFYE